MLSDICIMLYGNPSRIPGQNGAPPVKGTLGSLTKAWCAMLPPFVR